MSPAPNSIIPRYESDDDDGPRSEIRRRATDNSRASISTEPVVIDEEGDSRAPSKARRIAVRVLGGVAVAASIVGLWRIAESPQARHALLQWGTLGHANQAIDARDAVAKSVH